MCDRNYFFHPCARAQRLHESMREDGKGREVRERTERDRRERGIEEEKRKLEHALAAHKKLYAREKHCHKIEILLCKRSGGAKEEENEVVGERRRWKKIGEYEEEKMEEEEGEEEGIADGRISSIHAMLMCVRECQKVEQHKDGGGAEMEAHWRRGRWCGDEGGAIERKACA